MGFIISIIFVLLFLSLFLYKVKSGEFAKWANIFRIFTLVFAVSFFSYWFIKKSSIGFVPNSMPLQLINKLPQALDFYVINTHNRGDGGFETQHLGIIRPEYYRIEHLKMDASDEYWIAGYLGKKNLVYFSQHSVPNKNIDQMVEVQNYIVQSEKLSDRAKKQVETYNAENLDFGIWVILCLILTFLNLMLLLRRK